MHTERDIMKLYTHTSPNRGSVVMTKTEARRIARLTRQRYGYYRISATLNAYPCLIHDEARISGPRHRINVHHKPWEKVTASMVDAAIVQHLTCPYSDERCEHVEER